MKGKLNQKKKAIAKDFFCLRPRDYPGSDPTTAIQKAIERRARIYGKFVEKEYEKCDRLVEVLVEHRQKVRDVEERVKEEIALVGEELGEEEKETMLEVAVLEVISLGRS